MEKMCNFNKKKCLGAVFLVLVLGCDDVGDFSTKSGECYRGEIGRAEYVRSESFQPDSELTLVLDADALGRGSIGTTISTNNGIFDKTPVTQMAELSHDSLSMLQFPGGRVHNYLAYARPDSGSPATVVISLMENKEVEVRILRPDLEPEDQEDTALFGIFKLVRKEGCGI